MENLVIENLKTMFSGWKKKENNLGILKNCWANPKIIPNAAWEIERRESELRKTLQTL